MKMSKFLIWPAFMIFIGLLMAYPGALAYGAEVEIPSSFNPVGSGARALGFGGAFIAVADDATAASWNPGGLTQLRKPECSVVGSFFHRGEDITFGTNPEADGSHSISDQNINYLSVTYPFEISKYNMVVSLSYQHLYDFNRELGFTLRQTVGEGQLISDDILDYEQTGSLSAVGLSYSIRIFEQFSAGFTLNLWDDDLSPNSWESNYQNTNISTMIDMQVVEKFNIVEEHSINGFNFNTGFLWKITPEWTLGGVFKSSFKADVEHKVRGSSVIDPPLYDPIPPETYTRDEELEMPMSYGIGILHDFSDNFSMSADIYRTEWDDCVYKDSNRNEISPITGGDAAMVDPTHQVRIGGEYRFINKEKKYLIPIRAGIFYDPAPDEGNPDDFYGFSLGLGFTKSDWFSLDVAYQYRFGNNVGHYLVKGRQFSQDVDEHMAYVSMIWYKF